MPDHSPAAEPTRVYVPGRRVICTDEQAAPEYHVAGWFPPEAALTWIDGIEAELRFSVRRPAISYTFEADVRPITDESDQSLEVFFNFFRVGYFELRERTTIQIELPAELFIFRVSRLGLHCRNAVVGRRIGLSDDRRLGVAFFSWMLS